MIRKIFIVIAILMFICGLFFSSYPFVQSWIGQLNQKKEINEFYENQEQISHQSLNQLKEDMQKYNQDIYLNHQQNLKDAWDYEDEVFSLENYEIDTETIGILEIKAMNITLPLYLGASHEHLSQGATVLGQTSMPIGGHNVNTVIAGHRGYRGESMFRDIEKLKKGDVIVLTNLWETITYKVYAIRVIAPNDIEAIKIVEDCDMLTLITCHPYTQNYQRYVVYCVREGEDKKINQFNFQESIDYESSSYDIERERYVSILGICVSLLSLIFVIAFYKCKKS